MSSALTVFEHSYYIGNYMSGILYGVELVMYFLTLQGLFRKGNRNSVKSKRFFTIYSTVLLLLLTIDISANAVWGEQMWITFRDSAGGVPAFLATQTSDWYETMGSTSVVIMVFLGDALLLYRLFILYGTSFFVIALPALAYLAAFALAIIELVIAGKPGGNFFHGHAINFGVPYYTITIAFNIFVTFAIVYRLLKLGKAVSRALGPESANVYTNTSAMLIESAAPYSIFGIMFLIPYALGHGTAISFGQVWAKIACLSPQLIVLRVVTGKAWVREIVTQAQSNVQFVVRPTGVSTEEGAEKWNSSKSVISA
ncbi:hypothetical protein CPC08DRAFT_797506 [Agrocybe pediades]|nr:hypothetical protein CPC08DRAFT_797506 [Agrocybe pediades]